MQKNYTKNFSVLALLVVLFTNLDAKAMEIINCNSVDCIQNAVSNAKPGDEIIIAPGTYNFRLSDKIPGAFGRAAYLYSNKNGTKDAPIILRGADANNKPTIKGVDYNDGYLFGLEGNYWVIKNIEFRTGSKGVILDNADFTQLENLEIHDVGEEALHFRHGTTNSTATGCFIHDTGRNPGKTDFGEGIYIGSDRSVHNLDYNVEGSEVYCQQWKRNEGRCGRFYNPFVNNITIKDCVVGPNVTAEHIDVREGTHNVYITNNTFDAAGIINKDYQDSFIDVKSSFTYIDGNTFNQNGSVSIKKGIQVLDRDNGEDLIELTAYNNVISNNTFNMDDTTTPILTYFQKRNYKSDNYAYNNVRNPSGTLFQSGSDFTEEIEPDFSNITDFEVGNQDSELAATTLSTRDFPKNTLSFSVTPNPVNDIISINTTEVITSVKVYNLQGQNIMSINANQNSNKINLSELRPGVYIIAVKTVSNFGTEMIYKL